MRHIMPPVVHIKTTTLAPNPNPPPIDVGAAAEEDLAAESKLDTPVSTEGVDPNITRKRRGRPPGKTAAKKDWGTLGAPGASGPETNATPSLQDQQYAKVGRLAVYAAKSGKTLDAFVEEIEGLVQAYVELKNA